MHSFGILNTVNGNYLAYVIPAHNIRLAILFLIGLFLIILYCNKILLQNIYLINESLAFLFYLQQDGRKFWVCLYNAIR